jgi:hypothetical protein
LSDELAETAAELRFRLRLLTRYCSLGDHCAAVAAEIEPAFSGKQAICLRDGVEMHTEVEAKFADCWKTVARLKRAFDKQGAKIIDHLAVNRYGGAGIDIKFGLSIHCCLYVYNVQIEMSTEICWFVSD